MIYNRLHGRSELSLLSSLLFLAMSYSLPYLFSAKMLGMSELPPNIYGDLATDLANAGIVSIFGAPNGSQLAAIVAASPSAAAAAAEAAAVGVAAGVAAGVATGSGSGSGSGSGPCPAPVCDPIEQTNLLLKLLDSIYTTVDRLFPLITIAASDRAAATATTYIQPRAFARLYWAQTHKGIRFGGSPADPVMLRIHLLQLKDIYLMLGLDLTIEPLFLLLPLVEPSVEPSTTPSTTPST